MLALDTMLVLKSRRKSEVGQKVDDFVPEAKGAKWSFFFQFAEDNTEKGAVNSSRVEINSNA